MYFKNKILNILINLILLHFGCFILLMDNKLITKYKYNLLNIIINKVNNYLIMLQHFQK